MNWVESADVLRGMDIETVAVRLRRAATKSPAELAAKPSGEELAVRRGYEDGLRQGQAEGVARGYEDGAQKARAELAVQAQAAIERAVSEATLSLKEQRERLAALIAAIEREEGSRHQHAEDAMVALCYEAICAVLGARAVRPATVRAHLAHVVSQLGTERSGVVLHVHAQDAALMTAAQPVCDSPHPSSLVRWVADPEVALGGCVVARCGGGLDLRLETAMERCKEVLLQARARRRNPAGEKS